MSLLLPPDYPDTLAEIAQVLYQRLSQYSDDPAAPAAADLARQLTQDLSRKMHGQVYIPKWESHARRVRNQEICAAFRAGSCVALANRYGLSPSMIYAIVAREFSSKETTGN